MAFFFRTPDFAFAAPAQTFKREPATLAGCFAGGRINFATAISFTLQEIIHPQSGCGMLVCAANQIINMNNLSIPPILFGGAAGESHTHGKRRVD